jgi:hypothetical protein
VVTCADVTFTITGVTTNTVTFDANFHHNCQFIVSGTPVGSATVDVGCDWSLTLHHAVFDSSTGAGTGGTIDTNCTTAVTVPAVNCQINIYGQTRPGISTQNIDTTGVNTSSAAPWGSKITASLSGLTYTVPAGKTCPGFAEHGTGAYASTVAIKNIWGML